MTRYLSTAIATLFTVFSVSTADAPKEDIKSVSHETDKPQDGNKGISTPMVEGCEDFIETTKEEKKP